MTNNRTRNQANYWDWIAVALMVGPLWFFGNLFQFHLAIHYFLYIVGLVCAIVHFIQDGLRLDTTSLQQWFPRILILIFFWDIWAPFQSVSTFSLLKLLFYLLIFIQLSLFLFGSGRFFGSIEGPLPLIILLVLTTLRFAYESFSARALETSLIRTLPFWKVLLTTPILVLILVILMIVVIASLLWGATWIELRRKPILLVAGGLAAFLSAFVVVCDFRYGISLPFQVQFLCLFLYLFTLPICDATLDWRIHKFVDFAFAATFLLLYLDMNSDAIFQAFREVLKRQQTIGIWWNAALGAIGLVGSIYSIVEFHRRTR